MNKFFNYKPSNRIKIGIIVSMLITLLLTIRGMIRLDILRDQYVMTNCVVDLIIMAILIMLVISCFDDDNVFINYMIALYTMVWTAALGSTLIGFPNAKLFITALYTASYILTGVSITLFGFTLVALIPNQRPSKGFVVAAIALGAIYIAIAFINVFTGFFFTVNEYGRISYSFYDAPRTFCLLAMLTYYIAFVFRAKCDRKLKVALLVSAIFPVIACIANIVWVLAGLNYQIESFTNVSYIFSVLLIFVNVYQRNKNLYKEQEAALKQARVNLLVSQIHPHFVSNTLGMIRSMYRGDAKAAEGAMNTFISYLQKNFSDLSSNIPIPVTREIEHVKEFIDLELLRWPDMAVEYDITTTAFELPSMTLQPLVENAINHGLMPLASGGTIKIATKETEEEFLLTVEDNGVGFNTNSIVLDSARNHIGLSNVEERLKRMCQGYLEIKSEKGKGTLCIVHIPKGAGR